MPLAAWIALAAFAAFADDPSANARTKVIVVLGVQGEPQFGEMFAAWGEKWREAASRAGAEFLLLGGKPDDANSSTDRERLQDALAAEPRQGEAPLWLTLIGHGAFDGKIAKFNLTGPDVTAAELAEWLAPIERHVAVINCSSSSGPFINALSHANRIIITATRSGDEKNFARFGEYLAAAIADQTADLDKDRQTSLLEAFLLASAETARFYKEKGRLATEHPLLDDNGDSQGTPPDWYQGVRVVKSPAKNALPDGFLANQWRLGPASDDSLPPEARQRRDALEREIEKLRQQKATLSEEDYYARLEKLCLELARLGAAQ